MAMAQREKPESPCASICVYARVDFSGGSAGWGISIWPNIIPTGYFAVCRRRAAIRGKTLCTVWGADNHPDYSGLRSCVFRGKVRRMERGISLMVKVKKWSRRVAMDGRDMVHQRATLAGVGMLFGAGSLTPQDFALTLISPDALSSLAKARFYI